MVCSLEKNIKTITEEFSIFLTNSKRSPLKIESDRGSEWYNFIFQYFLNLKNIQLFSSYRDKGPSITESFIRTKRSLLKKPVFEKGKADWLSELPSVFKKYNDSIRNSIKMTPIQASKKSNEREVCINFRDDREKQKPKLKLGHLVRTADIKRVFNEGDSTNWSHILYTITEVIDDSNPSYRTDYLPESYNENLLRSAKLSLDENDQNMKKLILIQ